MDLKLEVLTIPVSDVDRATAFYGKLGFRLDIDVADGDFRAVHFTPPGSEASILFGKGVTSAKPGSADNLVLAVDDVDAARHELIARGIDVSEVFHYAGGPFNDTVKNPRVAGRDPEGRSYFSFASFKDPDGNGWLLQEITKRLPGRVASQPLNAESADILLSTLKSTAAAHGVHEKELGKPDPDWPQWYAAHMTKTLSEAGYRLSRVSTGSAART
jgi:catechol 2,3-dioxygenase-like lactoylglutathione lyase family enzyme